MIHHIVDLHRQIARARTSGFHRWLLNAGLRWSIPFNRPHGFRVVPLADGGIRVEVPFKRANRNHIRGMHACCLATAAELCSGLALISRSDPGRHRIIMGALRMDYHWQAKTRVQAVFHMSGADLEQHLLQPLRNEGVAVYTARVELHDAVGKQVATGHVTWQVKPWKHVRTLR